MHPDNSLCWETDEIPDGFHNQPQENCTDEPEPSTLHLPGQPLASIRCFLGEFGPCFKCGCPGPCSPSLVLSLQLPGSSHHEQRPAMSRRAGQSPSELHGRSSGRTSRSGKPHKGTGMEFVPRSLGH